MRALRVVILSGCLAASGACGQDELRLYSRIEQTALLEIRGPQLELPGNCDVFFGQRFCAEQFESFGAVQMGPNTDRTLGVGASEVDRCAHVLWIRVVSLEGVGPVDDPGTLFETPVDVDLEYGAGALHSVAYPQGIVRLDQFGPEDAQQSGPPHPCP